MLQHKQRVKQHTSWAGAERNPAAERHARHSNGTTHNDKGWVPLPWIPSNNRTAVQVTCRRHALPLCNRLQTMDSNVLLEMIQHTGIALAAAARQQQESHNPPSSDALACCFL